MRTNLQVPFAEKDEAKRLGAKWDPARKLWYVVNAADLTVFARWLPNLESPPGTAAPRQGHGLKPGITIVGSAFVEHTVACACPPWEICDNCRSAAIAGIATA